jgi:glycosyltransferase involved in cell wall biosynthesis
MTSVPPLVSVVLPVFNGERFLAAAIESVLAQTHEPLELLVVNDGSTDASGTIARSFARVRYLEQQNAGVAAARNAGVATSSGEFVAFIDQDDVWLPGKISAQLAVMVADPSIDWCVACQRRFLDPSASRPAWIPAELLDAPVTGPDPSTVFVRRSAFDRVGMYDASYCLASDVDWAFRASEAGLRQAVVEEALVLRRVHDANNSRFVQSNHAEIRRIAMASIRRRREAGRG